jgi:ATP-dependent Lon protease
VAPEQEVVEVEITLPPEGDGPQEDHYRVYYGDVGHSYESIFGKYLQGSKTILIQDPYIRQPHQIHNLIRLCWFGIGSNDLDLRPCLETMVDIYLEEK